MRPLHHSPTVAARTPALTTYLDSPATLVSHYAQCSPIVKQSVLRHNGLLLQSHVSHHRLFHALRSSKAQQRKRWLRRNVAPSSRDVSFSCMNAVIFPLCNVATLLTACLRVECEVAWTQGLLRPLTLCCPAVKKHYSWEPMTTRQMTEIKGRQNP